MNNNFKLLKKINFDNKNKLKSEQVIYRNKEWEFKTIASNLTHNFLMDNNNFPDQDNQSNLIIDVDSHLKRRKKMQIVKCITDETTFLFNKTQFRNFVDIIPYMAFDNYFVCPCSRLIEHIYFIPFKIARPIIYLKCD